MNKASTIHIEMQAGLAIVSLTQPERGNPIDSDLARDFRQAIQQLWDTPGLRAVLLRAEGENFSFGGDIKMFYPERANMAPLLRSWTADMHMGLQRAWQLPVPVVVAVQGWALGAGTALLAGCDMVLAGESARIGSAFAKIGFSCDSGSSVTLTARMGVARARRFVLMREVLGSQEALQAGLADRVVPDAELQAQALALAQEFAAGPTVAYGEIKRLFLRAGSAQLEAQLEDEAMTLARVSVTADAREGISAQVERRKAVFRGC
ncbi:MULTISPECIES: enoyl-CoA hydratase/isomerase family protein [Polaromonas]|uniref:Enoyl-CoA hydratase/isomerase family protein n=1 Tax=Polaromonas aquatica TaxID=332657 RepID=A0ABW1U1W5_9BURK